MINLEVKAGRADITVYTAAVYEKARVVLTAGDETLYDRICTVSPADILQDSVETDAEPTALCLAVYDGHGRKLIDYRPRPAQLRRDAGHQPRPSGGDIT